MHQRGTKSGRFTKVKRIRYLVIPAFAALMTFMVMSATAGTVYADNCANGYVNGDFSLCYGWSVTGDVRMDGTDLFDTGPGSEWTGLVVTCWKQPSCTGWVNPLFGGANVSSKDSNTLANELRDHGCLSRCISVRQRSWPENVVQPTYPVPVYPTYPTPVYPPTVVYPPVYPSGTWTSWGGSITIGISGPNSWIVISSSGQTFTQECWFPATPPGGGRAHNAVPNVANVSNPPPTNLPLCGPISTSNGLMEIRTADWYPGQYTGVQGIAIALNNPPGTACNSGNCTVDSTTAASVGGRVWFLAPYGSPANSVSPFTSATTTPQTPQTVFPGTTAQPVR